MAKLLNLNGLLPAKIHKRLCTEIQNDGGLPISNYDEYLNDGTFKPNPGSSANMLIINPRTMSSFVKSAINGDVLLLADGYGNDDEEKTLCLLLPDSDVVENNKKTQHFWYSFFTKRLKNPIFMCKYDDSIIKTKKTLKPEEVAMQEADFIDEDRVKYNNILLSLSYKESEMLDYISDIKIKKGTGKAKTLHKDDKSITGVKPGDYTVTLITTDTNDYTVTLAIGNDTVEFTRDGDTANYVSNSTVNIPDSKENIDWQFAIQSNTVYYNVTVSTDVNTGGVSVYSGLDSMNLEPLGDIRTDSTSNFTIEEGYIIKIESTENLFLNFSKNGNTVQNDSPTYEEYVYEDCTITVSLGMNM